MPRFSVVVSAAPLARALGRGLDTRPLLNEIGAYVSSQFKKRFQTQPWAERRVPNVAGIVRYLSRGQQSPEIPTRYFQSRPALVDSGRLRDSITHRIDSANSVAVGTNVSYARRQARGEPETMLAGGPHGDPAVREGLRRWLARQSDPQFAGMLDWLLQKDTITIAPLPRDFLAVDPPLLASLTGLIERWIEQRVKEQ